MLSGDLRFSLSRGNLRRSFDSGSKTGTFSLMEDGKGFLDLGKRQDIARVDWHQYVLTNTTRLS